MLKKKLESRHSSSSEFHRPGLLAMTRITSPVASRQSLLGSLTASRCGYQLGVYPLSAGRVRVLQLNVLFPCSMASWGRLPFRIPQHRTSCHCFLEQRVKRALPVFSCTRQSCVRWVVRKAAKLECLPVVSLPLLFQRSEQGESHLKVRWPYCVRKIGACAEESRCRLP
jgi:hypothetical protein